MLEAPLVTSPVAEKVLRPAMVAVPRLMISPAALKAEVAAIEAVAGLVALAEPETMAGAVSCKPAA